MTSALDQLLNFQASSDRFETAPADLLPLQLEAANERLQSRIDQIPLLKNRASTAEITKVTQREDLVPLLFAHSAYKSYAESWLVDGRWDRMAKWVRTVSAYPIDGLDLEGVQGLDDFVTRLESVGYYVTCSSGTTGKPAMIACSEADLTFASEANVHGLSWATGIAPEGDRRIFGLGPRTNVERNERTRLALTDAFSSAEKAFQLDVPTISVGSIMGMIAFRRRIADGTASPSEVAAFERLSTERQASMSEAVAGAVDALIACGKDKLLLSGMFASLYEIAEGVRAKGLSSSHFRDDTALFVGGGLKGATLPDNYREYILDTFNIAQERVYHFYTMQELNTPFPKCHAGRYHVAPWVLALPLDEPGENLLDISAGEIQGRAAFVDLSIDGRWGGVISGDQVNIDFSKCACGHQGPSIAQDITRYSDLGGDKISCAGTIDAYVRGEA
ncbi:hypothetical protein [Mycobacterium sp. 48b]|uniref:LuxE/PaaK family acyltransferase n=1 Tax=Mycobacterium sp. 48b TaxID=3400426 RepID=UPI003AAAAB66